MKGRKKKKLGLALGSGGACGIAHIGFLRALEEYHIEPHIITGTSMGAIVGAAYAAGITLDELEQRVMKLRMMDIIDIDPLLLKALGVLRGRKIEKYLTELLPVKTFEELSVKFSTLAVNLMSGEPKIFDRGDLIAPLRATSAIPFVFHPVEIEGELYVDGGVLERVPCNLARENGAEVVLGVDVISGVRGIGQPKNCIDAFLRAYSIIDDAFTRAKPQTSDIFLRVSTGDIDQFKAKDLDTAIVRGYDCAIENIDDILHLIEG